MKEISLVKKFSFLSFIAIILAGLLFGSVITLILEKDMLERSRQVTASYVAEEFKRTFHGEDIVSPKYDDGYQSFSGKMKSMTLLPVHVERIKVWNKDMAVVWSDEENIVGIQFSDNEDLKEALNGEIVSEISSMKKTEHHFEQKFRRLMEMYVPIRLSPEAGIHTVLEIYQNLDPLYLEISYYKRVVWAGIATSFSAVYLVLFGIVVRASRRIQRQTVDIIKSEERYRTLVESVQDAIISVDHKGIIILFNKASEQIFGYASDEVIGQHVAVLIPETYKSHHVEGMQRFLETGKAVIMGRTVEFEGETKQGRVFPMELSLSFSGQFETSVITAIIRDISERKAIQAHLIEAEKQASVSIIAGSIGHELNNATASIMGYSELLMQNPADRDFVMKCAGIFGTQSLRLKMHAQNLLSLSKPRQPEMKLLDVNMLADKVTEMLVQSGLLKRFEIEKHYAEDLPRIQGDEMLLEQVISNLEINAAHAMDSNGVLTVGTRMTEDSSFVEFQIADTGHGIPEDRRGQIFIPFYTTKEKGKGTGLGMYIIKKNIEQHRGYIKLESQVGKGTTVTVGLPVA